MLELISKVVQSIKMPDDPLYLQNEHTTVLNDLEARLKSLRQIFQSNDVENIQERIDMIELIAELYRVATLIYIERIGRGASRFSPNVVKLVEDAFIILSRLDRCERPFPFFIISCEARTDAQRTLVMNIMDSTSSVRNCGNLKSIRALVQAAWIQDDLHEEQELSCFAKYNAVMSAYQALPSFA